MKRMKKLIPATMAGAMIFGMGVPVLANVEGDVNDNVEYEADGNGGLNAEVPVDGRINRQTVDINPDPDPDDIIAAQVSTEAVMWWVPSVNGQSYVWNNGWNLNRSDLDDLNPNAYNGYKDWYGDEGFLNGANTEVGKVYSPDYAITNIGSSDLTVDLVGFYDGNRFSNPEANQLQSGTNEYNEYENLTLTLLGLKVEGEVDFELVSGAAIEDVGKQLTEIDGNHVLDAGYTSYVYDEYGEVDQEGGLRYVDGLNKWKFAIGGEYSGKFYEEELQYDHNMVLNFALYGDKNDEVRQIEEVHAQN